MTVTVLTWNTLFAGRDGADDLRAKAQVELINDVRPDVFLMQEAKGLENNAGASLYGLEQKIGMRGFLALAPRSGQNVAVFIGPRLRPLSFDADSTHFHHALAVLKVALPDSDRSLTFISAHLCPNGPDVRRREVAYLGVLADPDALTLLAGDFNSASPHDDEPTGFDSLAAHHRSRYLGDDLRTADRSVLARLEAAGWVDVGFALGDQTPTVPTRAFTGTEFPVMRCDYMLVSQALARHARTYEVMRTPLTDAASDHYPILSTFEI